MNKFAKKLKAKDEPELILILKYNKVICQKIVEKLENGGLEEYFGMKIKARKG